MAFEVRAKPLQHAHGLVLGWWVELAGEVRNVVGVGEAACLGLIVPGDVDARKFSTIPVGSEGVMLLEGLQEMVGMSAFGVLDTKVVNDKDE